MKTYKIRVTGDVLETAAATRRVNVSGQVLTFGREPVYLRADELPSEIADDLHLRVEALPADTALPPGSEVINLKSERLQEPEADPIPVDPDITSGEEPNLKSERLQDPEPPLLPDDTPGGETDLKSERLQESTAAPVQAAASRKRR
jgi:hypothetical protein